MSPPITINVLFSSLDITLGSVSVHEFIPLLVKFHAYIDTPRPRVANHKRFKHHYHVQQSSEHRIGKVQDSVAMAVEYKLWNYTPSVAGGVVGAIAFAILTSLHTYRLIRNRTWFCIPFVIGGLVSIKLARRCALEPLHHAVRNHRLRSPGRGP
jgi:hypothetical protein